MRLWIHLLLSVSIAPGLMPIRVCGADSPENRPARDTPLDLARIWLRFHETELCQGVRAVFKFESDGMAVRSLVEDERSYQRFLQMLGPLRGAYRIELDESRPPEDKKSGDSWDPPPSLWENYTLRSYLRDPFAESRDRLDPEDAPQEDPSMGDWLLKRRLWFFAEQTLDWNKRMERYAEELPALTHTALDISVEPEVRSRASAICGAHARNLGKYLEKLEENLERALPQSASGDRPPAEADPSAAIRTSAERAAHISAAARRVGGRIHSFFYPEQHTVEVEELRQPSLLQSLKELQRANEDFQKTLGRPGPP